MRSRHWFIGVGVGVSLVAVTAGAWAQTAVPLTEAAQAKQAQVTQATQLAQAEGTDFQAAQTTSAPEASDVQPSALSIAQQRQNLRLAQEQLEAECYQRFAVSDCLERSRRNYRIELTDLKRQENILKSEARRARGGQELARIDAKQSSPETETERLARQQKAEANAARQAELSQDRHVDALSRELARQQSLAAFEERQKKHAQILNDLRAKRADEARHRTLYEQKLDAAAKQREKQNAQEFEQQGKPAVPLLPRP